MIVYIASSILSFIYLLILMFPFMFMVSVIIVLVTDKKRNFLQIIF